MTGSREVVICDRILRCKYVVFSKKQAEYIRDYADKGSTKKLKYTVVGFLFPFKVSFIY